MFMIFYCLIHTLKNHEMFLKRNDCPKYPHYCTVTIYEITNQIDPTVFLKCLVGKEINGKKALILYKIHIKHGNFTTTL